jgi:hypothetical protein
MTTYIVGYDLNKAGKNYAELIAEIKAIANGFWHHLDSTWLVNSDLSAGAIRDRLKKHLDGDDELLVIAVANSWATYGVAESGNKWLRESLQPACFA